MLNFLHPVRIRVSPDRRAITISYRPRSNRALYDLCEPEGNTLVSGKFRQNEGTIPLWNKAPGSELVLLVLDGKFVVRCNFTL